MNNTPTPLGEDFFHRDCLDVAPDLVGKLIIRNTDEGEIRLRITEAEAYRGEEDTACHASKGRTPRTELLYREAGVIYVYLCLPLADERYHRRKGAAPGRAFPCVP